MRALAVHLDLCSGCRLCLLACSARRGGYNPHLAMMQLEHEPGGLFHRPVVCLQCENPFCLNSCPREAIYRREGLVVIRADLCNGCGICTRTCPQEVIFVDKEKHKAFKCDLCRGEEQGPLCAAICPTKALRVQEGDR